MNNFGVGYAENLKNGCNSHGEAIILNPSRRDTTMIHDSFKFQIARQSSEFVRRGDLWSPAKCFDFVGKLVIIP